jgi:hypothetical protein
MKFGEKTLCIALILCIGTIAPALAGTEYLSGSPQISASLAGTNGYGPGNAVQLTITVQNTGLNEFKFVQRGIIDREDLPNTAKSVTVGLSSGTAPVVIKSDPQMLGDIKGTGSANAVFTIKINSDALAGRYTLPLFVNYTYLYQAEQFGGDTIQYNYKQVNETVGIPITIESDISIKVQSATPEHLNIGSEGYLSMKIKNTGSEDGSKAIVKILRNGNSPIMPTDSSVYIGDFRSGSTVECRYKVSVSVDAQRQTYPVDVVVVYQNRDGDFITSRTDTVGIPVGSKVDFAVISPPAEMNPGNKKIITVEYKNLGETVIYSAQSRISAVEPFTSNDDIAYLGDLQPGKTAVASYEVSLDRSATIKQYALDSEIRYRDALDTTYLSDTMKVSISVNAPSGITALVSNPVYLALIVAGVIGLAYGAFHFRKKNNNLR